MILTLNLIIAIYFLVIVSLYLRMCPSESLGLNFTTDTSFLVIVALYLSVTLYLMVLSLNLTIVA